MQEPSSAILILLLTLTTAVSAAACGGHDSGYSCPPPPNVPADIDISECLVDVTTCDVGPTSCAIQRKGPAISFLASQLPSTGAGVDPNTLTVRIGDIEPTCTDLAANPPCGDHWFISYSLPPAMQQEGTYDIASLEGGFDLATSCPESRLGGGALGKGTITVQHVDAQGVDFTLNAKFHMFGYVKDTFHAPRCP